MDSVVVDAVASSSLNPWVGVVVPPPPPTEVADVVDFVLPV